MTVRKLICTLMVLTVSLSCQNFSHALSLDGNCSNWKVGKLTNSKGMNREAEAKAICANLGKSGDAITVFDPRNQTCLLCSKDDWTPGSSSSSSGNNSAQGKGKKVAADNNVSSKPACHMRTGYMFSDRPDAEFNVLKERNPKRNEYFWHYYTVARPTTRSSNPNRDINNARKGAQRIVAEGKEGRQYDFALQGNLNEFCNYLKKKCDIEKSVLKALNKACGWSK